MSIQSRANGRTVLISGASIAGTTLAYWLHRYGFAVTVVERSATIRLGGYAIDVRGNAVDVADRMGIVDALNAAALGSRTIHFVDANGENAISMPQEPLTGGQIGRDVELPRGALTSLLYGLSRDVVEYRFNRYIKMLVDEGDGVEVTFDDESRGRYDLVIGADGLHSSTRKMVFGPESQFDHNIGFCFAVFDVPNTFGMQNEAFAANKPGKLFVIVAQGAHEPVNVFFNTVHPPITREQGDDPAFQRALFRTEFADWGWKVPEMLDAMDRADDLFFDEIKQIRMPSYSKVRVALVGDAAGAPSFLTGQGSSLAMVGAYVLAGELALSADHATAYRAYDQVVRPFVGANQALVGNGESMMIPLTQDKLDARNAILATIADSAPPEGRAEHSMLDLSKYLRISA